MLLAPEVYGDGDGARDSGAAAGRRGVDPVGAVTNGAGAGAGGDSSGERDGDHSGLQHCGWAATEPAGAGEVRGAGTAAGGGRSGGGAVATPAMAEPHESAGAPVEDAEVELVPLLAAEGEGVPEEAPVAAEPETGGGFGGLRVRPRFREVREQWDKSLARTEGQMTDALTMTAEEREQRRAKREAEDEAGLRVDPLDVYFGRVGVGNAAVGM